jgi:hypothetical protein
MEDSMTRNILLPLATAAALALTACQARIGNHADPINESANVSAEGKAKEGEVSIRAPGFDLKVTIPEGIRDRAGIDDHDGIMYPNSNFDGIHVEGGRQGADGRSQGAVELAFSSADAPDIIARWYQDPARAAQFTVATANREGADFVIAGTTKDDGGQFQLRLSPRQGGGTAARINLTDRD